MDGGVTIKLQAVIIELRVDTTELEAVTNQLGGVIIILLGY